MREKKFLYMAARNSSDLWNNFLTVRGMKHRLRKAKRILEIGFLPSHTNLELLNPLSFCENPAKHTAAVKPLAGPQPLPHTQDPSGLHGSPLDTHPSGLILSLCQGRC